MKYQVEKSKQLHFMVLGYSPIDRVQYIEDLESSGGGWPQLH